MVLCWCIWVGGGGGRFKCESYQPTELSFDTCGTLEWKILKLLYIITLQGMDKHVFLMHTAVGSTVTACVQNNSLLPASAWACRTRAARAPITRQHVFGGGVLMGHEWLQLSLYLLSTAAILGLSRNEIVFLSPVLRMGICYRAPQRPG